MKSRVIAKVMACTLILATVLAGCGNSKDSKSSSAQGDGEVTLTFSWWGSDERHQAMQEVADLYMKEHQNVTIKTEFGAWDGWQSKVLTQLSGKTEPDVMQVNYNWVHSFGKGKNVFYNLSELEGIDMSNWDSEYLKAMEVGGEQAAVPHGMTGRTQVYNKSLFDENSIAFPTTYDEVKAAASTIGVDNTDTGADNKYVLMTIGKECPDLYVAQMLYNHTGKVMQTDGKVNYTEAEVKEVLDLYLSLAESGAMPTFQQEDPLDNESNPVWTSGRGGAIYEWAGTLDKYTASYKGGDAVDELEIAPYITEDGSKPNIYVKPNLGYAVSRNSKNPEVAADFINFMFTNEDAVKALKTNLGISSNKVTKEIQEREGMLSGKVKEAYEMINSYDQTVLDPYFEDENVRGQRYIVLEAFRSGKTDSSEAATQYITKQQEELDKLYD